MKGLAWLCKSGLVPNNAEHFAIVHPHNGTGCGGRIRTNDFLVMGQTSYHLLYPAE